MSRLDDGEIILYSHHDRETNDQEGDPMPSKRIYVDPETHDAIDRLARAGGVSHRQVVCDLVKIGGPRVRNTYAAVLRIRGVRPPEIQGAA